MRPAREVKWFIIKKVQVGDRFVVHPISSTCWVCGLTCECWPGVPALALYDRWKGDSVFKGQFTSVQTGVAKSQEALAEQVLHVLKNVSCGMRLYRQEAFVQRDVFVAHFGYEPGEKGSSSVAVTVPGLDGELWSGAVMQMKNVPDDVPFDILERHGQIDRSLRRELLGPAGIFREGQGAERFLYACKAAQTDYPVGFRADDRAPGYRRGVQYSLVVPPRHWEETLLLALFLHFAAGILPFGHSEAGIGLLDWIRFDPEPLSLCRFAIIICSSF